MSYSRLIKTVLVFLVTASLGSCGGDDSSGSSSGSTPTPPSEKLPIDETPIDEAPVARNDTATTPENTAVTISVLANDSAVNDNPIKVNIVTKPSNGTASVKNNWVVYTPESGGGAGYDSFKYDFTDSKGVHSNQALVNITIGCAAIHPYENYIAVGDSLTDGLGDDIAYDNVSADGCHSGRGYPPVLISKLNELKNRKHIVIGSGVNGGTSFDGSQSIGSILGGDSMHYLVMYGTNDSTGAASGLNTTRSTFKKNIQSIIDQIHDVGKKAYLAKIPPVLGKTNDGAIYENIDQGPRNLAIQKYNRAIDELVHENGINITPPDFYNHFKGRPELYSDNLHSNGRGYRDMAELWAQSLRSL